MIRRMRMTGVVLVVLALAACNPPPDQTPGTGASTTAPDGTVVIASLGLTFEPPPSFEAYKADDLLYAARSTEPPGLLTIDRDEPAVVAHEPGPGEIVSAFDVGGPDAIVIQNALIEGVPGGYLANELGVSNGDQSFSIIMSAPEDDLSPLWDDFVASVQVGSG